MRIRIYQDYVHNNGLLWKTLRDIMPDADLGFIDAADIAWSGKLDSDIDIFVMPGGADLWYLEKLEGPGNAGITKYVHDGGVYLGICAGAYYACGKLAWAADQKDNAIVGDRPLGFINATAEGPVLPLLHDQKYDACWQAVTTLTCNMPGAVGDYPVLYWAGPRFDGDENEFDVLARYKGLDDEPPAIVAAKVGKGLCIASGPHVEVTATGFKSWTYPEMGSFAETRAQVAHEMARQGPTSPVLLQALLSYANSFRTGV
jgi:glutamine amidotransferase-like uncharacterized protein